MVRIGNAGTGLEKDYYASATGESSMGGMAGIGYLEPIGIVEQDRKLQMTCVKSYSAVVVVIVIVHVRQSVKGGMNEGVQQSRGMRPTEVPLYPPQDLQPGYED
ncbi:hypothetical protein SCLCIDRAFT_150384 [Scleroderma citrinum Foug A]|uniref:Uncharacterized protein n=1 Tax=Scleroderma citrinum Foug A TaxID=1036808 RepID=A0A0C3AZM7_9AGAM|nr:hypothetical protein SCLCIDRAFT_150384 [Scleroderma citrinum Foug A]